MTLNHLASVQLLNKAGRYVAPSAGSFAAATANADWAATPDFEVDLTDIPGEASWPIVTATFVLVPKGQAKVQSSAAVIRFFDWAFSKGDGAATELQYVPLPQQVKAQIDLMWRQQFPSAYRH